MDIAVLLSTYNGERYLKEQLDSLLSQTIQDFVLIVRDDGSADGTYNILNEYKRKFKKFILLPESENLGIKKSFEKLLNFALMLKEIKYFMFCDQDDVWKNDKIEKTVLLLSKFTKPALVHTDLFVVDEDMKIIDSSFWHYQHINPSYNQLNRLLMQNTVTGCSMGINRELAKLSKIIPEEAIMHDWWFALVASAFGEINYLEESTLFYRQHSHNDVGAQRYNLKYIFKKLFNSDLLDKLYIQANAFYEIYKEDLSDVQRKILKDFISLPEKSFIEKRKTVLKYKFLKHGFFRNLGLMVKI